MLIEVKVPQLSESVAEATLVRWHKKVGEAVSRDENLIDIETDKVVLETPAPDAGVLVAIIKQDGASVTSGELIAQIDTDAKASAAVPAAAPVVPAGPTKHNGHHQQEHRRDKAVQPQVRLKNLGHLPMDQPCSRRHQPGYRKHGHDLLDRLCEFCGPALSPSAAYLGLRLGSGLFHQTLPAHLFCPR